MPMRSVPMSTSRVRCTACSASAALVNVRRAAPTLPGMGDVDKLVADAPIPDAKPNFLLVYFLPEKPPGDALATMVAPDGEEAKLAGREIYVHYPNGSGRSKLKLPALKPGTSRNLNTVRKLAEMAAAREDKN